MRSQFAKLQDSGNLLESIPVHISYEIIHLFSEGLYKSPHKAIEELVTNGYDANAGRVHVLLPEVDEDSNSPTSPLWVIDDGHGMDQEGFHQLWRIAESNKANIATQNGRPIIGQFGIGKLASYVLAWNLTHISCVDGRFLLTSMDFHGVRGQSLRNPKPMTISLHEVSEAVAREYLSEIKETRLPRLGIHVWEREVFSLVDRYGVVRLQRSIRPASDRDAQVGFEHWTAIAR